MTEVGDGHTVVVPRSSRGRHWWIVAVLVVVSLVGALLILPVCRSVRQQAVTARASIEARSLAIALTNYWNTYTNFPQGGTSNLMQVLTAQNADGQNPLRIVFIEFPRDRCDPQNGFLDPWGRHLSFTLDSNTPRVAVRSLGPNGVDDGGAGDDIVESYPLPAPSR
jgi:hypothetical protein